MHHSIGDTITIDTVSSFYMCNIKSEQDSLVLQCEKKVIGHCQGQRPPTEKRERLHRLPLNLQRLQYVIEGCD